MGVVGGRGHPLDLIQSNMALSMVVRFAPPRCLSVLRLYMDAEHQRGATLQRETKLDVFNRQSEAGRGQDTVPSSIPDAGAWVDGRTACGSRWNAATR